MTGAKLRQVRLRRPKQKRAQTTVAAIVEGATRVLAERGWSGFNTNIVAERAGVSIGSLYEYFPNKQAIIDAIFSEHLAKGEALVSAAADRFSNEDSLDALVMSLVEGFIILHKDDPRLHRVLSSEVPLSPETRSRMDALRRGVFSLVATALEGQCDKPKLTAQLLVETADSLTHRWFTEEDGGPTSPETMTQELTRMLNAYLALAAKTHH